MTIFFAFYVIGGVIGVLINLRFLVPTAYYDLKNAWGFLGALKTIGYHFFRITVLSCVCFFVSWVSVCQWESKSVPISGIEKCTTPTLDG